MTTESKTKAKAIQIFIITIILGFVLFIVPNLFFGIFRINGGLKGVNMAIIAIFQLVTIYILLSYSLAKLGRSIRYIGFTSDHWQRDSLLGMVVTAVRAVIVFGFVIPMTGGAQRPDVQEVFNALDGTTLGLVSLILLGVLGGIAEEFYNRGFFITIMKDMFNNERTGLWIATFLSILFFSVGHMPTSTLLWIDILVASIIYTSLFLITGRLTASMISHASWNTVAILVLNYLY